MLNRLRWILISYVTRPRLLVLAGCAATLLAIGWLAPPPHQVFQENFPQIPAARLLVNSQATLEEVRKSGRQREVDAIDLWALWMDMGVTKKWDPEQQKETRELRPAPEEFYRVLEEFPNLRWVRYGLTSDSNGQTQIAQVKGLQYLVLDGMPQIDLARLRPLQNLRRIDFKMHSTPSNIAALAELPKLEMLVFESRGWVGDKVFGELSRLPHLRILALMYYPYTGPQVALTDGGFAELANSRSLKTLYVGGLPPKDYVELFAQAQRTLPGKVLPAVVSGSRAPLFMMMLAPIGILALGMGIQLSSQFRHPLVRLAPEFGLSHTLVGALFTLGVIILGAVRIWSGGAAPIPALCVSAYPVVSVITMIIASSTTDLFDLQMTQRPLFQLNWALLTPGFVILLMPQFADRLLLGESPAALIGIAVLTIGSGSLGAWTLSRLEGWSAASSAASRPSSGKWEYVNVANFRPGWLAPVNRPEGRIENLLPGNSDWSWWNRIQRWRLGNPPLRILAFCLLMLLPYGAVTLMYTRTPTNAVSQSIRTFLAAQITFCMFFMVLGIVAIRWRSRMRILSLELLLPYVRRTLQLELIAAFVADVAPVCVCFSALAACGLSIDSNVRLDWKAVPRDFVFCLVLTLALAMEHGALAVVIERVWLGFAMQFLAVVVNVGAVIALLVRIPDSDPLHWTLSVVESQL